MKKNLEGQRFWTGLPHGGDPEDFDGEPGDFQSEYDRICTEGHDYIVFYIDGPNNMQAFEEHCAAATDRFLRGVDWGEWMRVRAMTKADALARYDDAFDQHRYWNNHLHREEANEREVLDIVLLPAGERPE